jgi:phosphoribosylformylglycinamidine synthase
VIARARAAGVAARLIGTVGGGALTLHGAGAISVDALRTVNEAWLPNYMEQV